LFPPAFLKLIRSLEACLAAARALDQHVSDLAFVHSAEWLRKFPRIEDRNAE